MSGQTRRRPALDGLRGLAVVAVVAYHLDVPHMGGGFVGVDLFFVLSGYLITTLLLNERRRSDGIDLVAFWGRRIRRLWPMAWLVLGGVGVAGLAGVWSLDRQHTLTAETAAALANVYNWWQAGHGGYVAQFVSPSPLRHFWSLAIEEQFYLVWPPMLVGLLALVRRRGPWVMWFGLGCLASLSIATAWISSPDYAYLSTISRSVALIAGAGLAYLFRATPMKVPPTRAVRRAIAVWGVLGAGVIVAVILYGTPDAPWLHRGGFAVIGLACAGLVASALCPWPIRRALRFGPTVWVGERSYAIYLIHWPLIVALGPEASLALKVGIVIPVTLLLADLSRRLVEGPVIARRYRPRTLSVLGVALLALIMLTNTAAAPTGLTPVEKAAATLEKVADPTAKNSSSSRTATTTTTPCVASVAAPNPFAGGPGLDRTTFTDVADPTAGCADQVKVLVVGDSLARGIANGLRALQDPRLLLWDRSVLGCSLGPEKCGDWRANWSTAVAAIHPDVVVFYANTVTDLFGVDDAPFLSADGRTQHENNLTDAVRVLSSGGARVLMALPATPGRPLGLYYCKGEATDSACDPDWVSAWDQSIRNVAGATGAGVIDAAGWIAARGPAGAQTDRPDGLHLSGTALEQHAAWLLPQILAADPNPQGGQR